MTESEERQSSMDAMLKELEILQKYFIVVKCEDEKETYDLSEDFRNEFAGCIRRKLQDGERLDEKNYHEAMFESMMNVSSLYGPTISEDEILETVVTVRSFLDERFEEIKDEARRRGYEV